MKRSEAINKLNECEWNLSNPEYTEKLLDFIERELGMLPPPDKIDPVTSYLIYAYYPNIRGTNNYELDRENSQLWDEE